MAFRRTRFLDNLYVFADRDPVASDDGTVGMTAGVRWLNEGAQTEFVCISAAVGAAVWLLSVSGSGGGFLTKAAADGYYRQKPAYTHTQSVASAVWTIVHNLGSEPAVCVQDSAQTQVEGAVFYVDANTLTITFSTAFSGTAKLT